MEHGYLRATSFAERLKRQLQVFGRSETTGNNDRFLRCANPSQQWQVPCFKGGHFVEWHVHLFQEVDCRSVKGSGKKDQSF